MTETFNFTDQDEAAVQSATKILLSRYRDFVSFEDVRQELYLWLFSHYEKAEAWREKHETRHAERTLIKALRNAGERYCRQEKAERQGYEPEDEFFYSIPMVADLLQLYFDPTWMVPPAIVADERVSGGALASESGNLMAMVADVGRAYEALPAPDKELLAFVYDGRAVVMDQIACKALEWDVTQSAAYSRIRRVVGRVRANLGGPSPYVKDPE